MQAAATAPGEAGRGNQREILYAPVKNYAGVTQRSRFSAGQREGCAILGPMTAGELIEKLKLFEPETQVLREDSYYEEGVEIRCLQWRAPELAGDQPWVLIK